ncbi:dihydrofolate reductase [Candidatus Peregrinibacteria bacterium]|nr:MAG: dihydrofolate reductase [Candidatus Peregrinibacteria bacterium]
MKFSIISALDKNRGIGKNNSLPWHLPADLKHFKETTIGGTVIMGRKTWESIPEKYRPFKERLNIVISRGELVLPEGVLLAHSLDEALELAEAHVQKEDGHKRKAFIIGGATLYTEAIQHSACEELLLTELEGSFDCDAFFPEISSEWRIEEDGDLQEENGIQFTFKTYKKDSLFKLANLQPNRAMI